jgi:hypothetical protein
MIDPDAPTYRTGPMPYPFIECLLCGARSFHPIDVAERYCGACHVFHDSVRAGRRALVDLWGPAVQANDHHECHEWRTARGACALCGASVAVNARD